MKLGHSLPRPGAAVQAHGGHADPFCLLLGSVYIPYHLAGVAEAELEESFLELSNAISVSVDQMTAPATRSGPAPPVRELLKKSGIREVSIVDEDMGVVDSTNRRRSVVRRR